MDRRDVPAYRLTEAAHYVRLAPATLRSWIAGRSYLNLAGNAFFAPLIQPSGNVPLALSFNNLIEAHVLRALRSDHGVSIQAVRDAIRYAEAELQLERLLLRKELRTSGGELLLDRYGELVSLSRSGQLAMRKLLESYLRRVEWDRENFPIRLYPFVNSEAVSPKPIIIDPDIAFGRPVVSRNKISVMTIAERIDAGESVAEVAADYDLSAEEVEDAVLYIRAA